MNQQKQGIIKSWISERGFGFIEVGEFPYDYDLFFHITSCGDYSPQRGDIINFTQIEYEGRQRADDIIPTGNKTECSTYFDNRVRGQRYSEARKTHLRYERGCTCSEDLEKLDYSDYNCFRKCWYCQETQD